MLPDSFCGACFVFKIKDVLLSLVYCSRLMFMNCHIQHAITAQNVNILFSCLQEFGSLVAFRSPGLAIARTFIQLVGEFDFEDTFKEGTLLYSPAAYILFFTFLITMPILFTNFLVSCHQFAMCLDNPSEQAPFMWQHMLIGRPNT